MEILQAQRGIMPAAEPIQEQVVYNSPPPLQAAQSADANAALLQGLTHANYKLPSMQYNAPPTRNPAALTHQEQLTEQQMKQIRQCSF